MQFLETAPKYKEAVKGESCKKNVKSRNQCLQQQT